MSSLTWKFPSWARLVSNLCSPPMVLAVTGIFLARHDSTTSDEALFLAGLYVVTGVLLPFAGLAWWVYTGRISSVHMPERRERYAPLTLYLICSMLAWVAVRLTGDYAGLRLLTGFMVAVTFAGLLVTFYWQISVHAGIMTGAVMIAGLIYGAEMAIILSPLIVLVSAARLHLKRHTPAQVAGGIALGAVLPLLLYTLHI